MTPLDYFLWCAVKHKCYADKSETIEALKDNIREAIGEIQLHTIDNVLKNWTDRVGYSMTKTLRVNKNCHEKFLKKICCSESTLKCTFCHLWIKLTHTIYVV